MPISKNDTIVACCSSFKSCAVSTAPSMFTILLKDQQWCTCHLKRRFIYPQQNAYHSQIFSVII